MHPVRPIYFILALSGVVLAACETPDALAPPAGEPPRVAALAPEDLFSTQKLSSNAEFQLSFDMDRSTGSWSRVMQVALAVDPGLLKNGVNPRLLLNTALRFLTRSGQVVLDVPTRLDVIDANNYTDYMRRNSFGNRLVVSVQITDAMWMVLSDVKQIDLIVEATVDVLMEEEGIVQRLGTSTGRAVFDMLNASLIKSPRDAFTNVDPVVWVTVETTSLSKVRHTEREDPASGAIDHLVVIAFELWSRLVDELPTIALEIGSNYAKFDGLRFIEQQPVISPVVDASDYLFKPRNDPLFDPVSDPATGLPIVDVERVIVVRSLLVPGPVWKLVEAELANGQVTVGVNIGLVVTTGSGTTVVDHVFLTGLAEPRPDPAWLLELQN